MKQQLLLLFMMLLSIVASADDNGTCGDNLTWTFVESTGTITISGSGAMYHYYNWSTPWYNYRAKILAVVIEDGVTSIGKEAFSFCSSLPSITIPNSVTSIGAYAFYGCSSLPSITISNSVLTIGGNAFYETGWYNVQSDGILYLDNWLIGYKGSKPTGEITIKSGTKGLADGAFAGCSGMTSITIPNSVTIISSSAFSNCSSLISITIPNSVTCIFAEAFSGCSSLISITIPNSVTYIGNYAFCNCSSLTSVIVEWATPVAIKSSTFSNQKNATLYVPKGCKAVYQAENYWNEFREIVETETPASDISQLANDIAIKKEEWYTIDGEKLSAKPAQKGIYIHNGKKVIIK